MSAKPEVKATKILSDRVKQADFSRNAFRVEPEQGTQLEQLLEPGYWVHVASKFRPGDKIEVFPTGGEFYAELLVLSGSRVHTKVFPLLVKRLSAEVKVESKKKENPFKIEHKGSIHLWSVIRASDKEYVKDGFATRDEAADWLDKNEAEMLEAATLV